MPTFLSVPKDSDFSIYNLPYGIFKHNESDPEVGVAFGNYILKISALADRKLFSSLSDNNSNVFKSQSLNAFISLGSNVWKNVRKTISALLEEGSILDKDLDLKEQVIIPMQDCTMLLPVEIGDYTDFYSSMEHATNVGSMFRDPNNALLPNWKHLPVGYHGRSSSIVVSGTEIIRPKGQFKAKDQTTIVFGPSQQLDFELEMGFIVGKETKMGESVDTKSASEFIFGMVLFNDWSARDIQSWEYQPLGPFLGKNFASSMSPWVVPMEALESFKVNGPVQSPEVLPYLRYSGKQNYDIQLEVFLRTSQGSETKICSSNHKYLYWNMAQQLAHHTINGCNIRVGDLYASGTISGPNPDSYGSMLELAWKGTKPIVLENGETRTFLRDGDTIIIKGFSEKDGKRVGFGEVSGKITPAML